MNERLLNGCLIKPAENGGWQVLLGIHAQTFKTRSEAVKFALLLRANNPVEHGTTGAMAKPESVIKHRSAYSGWVPRCIAGGKRPRKVHNPDDYAIIERMFNGCLVDEMLNGTWRVQYQDENPTPAQKQLGFHRMGFHQRTFKTREEAISFAHSLPRTTDSYPKENHIQALVDSVLRHRAIRRRRRSFSRSKKVL